jgi:hypothetical protein
MIWLIAVIVILSIGAIVRAVRAANRRQEMASFQTYASTAEPAFPLRTSESVLLAVAAHDFGAVRRLADDVITDEYPASFPLVACTSERLVIQMSVTDRTTDLNGSFPPRTPDLRHRIGEQFLGAERRISSCEWPWACVASIVASGDSAGFLWANERGSGAVTLSFMSVGDQARFVTTATAAIASARMREGITPIDPTRIQDDGDVEYLFPEARILCSDCGATILSGDQFCTGCGYQIFRLETAES